MDIHKPELASEEMAQVVKHRFSFLSHGLQTPRQKILALLGVACLVFFGIAPWILTTYILSLVILTLIYAFLGSSANILLGEAGLASLGQAAFFGGAAYAVAILTTQFHTSIWLAGAAGLLAAMVIAGVLGLVVSHLRHHSFFLASLAAGMVVWGLAYQWVSVTGGDNGISGVPRPDLFGFHFHGPAMYYFVLVFYVLALIVFMIVRRSPFGFSMNALRENEVRMRAVGYNTWAHQYIGYIYAALIAGVGGILYATYNQYVSPVSTSVGMSLDGLLMAIIGGRGTLFGSLLGAAVIVIVGQLISSYTQHWPMVLGGIYVLVVLYLPNGFLGKRVRKSRTNGRRWHRKEGKETTRESEERGNA